MACHQQAGKKENGLRETGEMSNRTSLLSNHKPSPVQPVVCVCVWGMQNTLKNKVGIAHEYISTCKPAVCCPQPWLGEYHKNIWCLQCIQAGGRWGCGHGQEGAKVQRLGRCKGKNAHRHVQTVG